MQYLFHTIRKTIETIEAMPFDTRARLRASNWTKLARGWPDIDITTTSFRQGLEEAGREELRAHLEDKQPVMLDLQAILRITIMERQAMVKVLSHIISWVNTKPVEAGGRSQANKPLLRDNLIAVFAERCAGADAEEESKKLERQVLDYTH